MTTMAHRAALRLWPILALPIVAQEEIAILTPIVGTVAITRYDTGERLAVSQQGATVPHCPIFSHDRISTYDDSRGRTEQLLDGSIYEFSYNTTFTISQIDLSAIDDQRVGDRKIEVEINLIKGAIGLLIESNSEVVTVTKTRSGYLIVKGTRFEVEVDESSGETRVVVLEGLVEFFHPESDLRIPLPAGSSAILKSEDDTLGLSIPEELKTLVARVGLGGAPEPLAIAIDQHQVEVPPGAAIGLTIGDDSLILSVERGSPVMADERDRQLRLRPGDRKKFDTPPEPPTGPETIQCCGQTYLKSQCQPDSPQNARLIIKDGRVCQQSKTSTTDLQSGLAGTFFCFNGEWLCKRGTNTPPAPDPGAIDIHNLDRASPDGTKR